MAKVHLNQRTMTTSEQALLVRATIETPWGMRTPWERGHYGQKDIISFCLVPNVLFRAAIRDSDSDCTVYQCNHINLSGACASEESIKIYRLSGELETEEIPAYQKTLEHWMLGRGDRQTEEGDEVSDFVIHCINGC